MASPVVRKKRNFKGLGLSAQALAPPPAEPEPLPILGHTLVPQRPAPVPGSTTTTASTTSTGSSSGTPAQPVSNASSVPTVVTPAAGPTTGGGKKKRPAQLALGAKSIGGSAAQEAQEKLSAADANGAANGKSILDESGMLTLPNGSGSAPGTATMGSASPFRSVPFRAYIQLLICYLVSQGRTTNLLLRNNSRLSRLDKRQ